MSIKESLRTTDLPAVARGWAKPMAWVAGAVMAAVLLARVVMSYCNTPVFCDSGYYLTTARLMHEGTPLYTGIRFAYPPLYEAWLSLMTGIAPHHYAFWISWNLLMTGLSAWLVYRIGRQCNLHRTLALAAAWLYLVGALTAGGEQVLLETPSCLAGLAACWLIGRRPHRIWSLLGAGVLAGAATFTKQYGIGFIALGLLWIVLGSGDWRQRLKDCLVFLLGFGLCAAAVIAVFPEAAALFRLSGAYGTDQTADAFYRKAGPLRFVPRRLKSLVLETLPLMLGLIPPIGRFNRNRLRMLLPLLCGFAGFMGQYYFSNGWHYLLYILPFAALLAAMALQDFAQRSRAVQVLLTAAALLTVGSVSVQALDTGAYQKKKKQYLIEQHVAKMLQPLPKNSVLLPYNAELYGQYWTSGLQPPKIDGRYCLSFGPLALTEALMNQKIAHSRYIVKYKRSTNWEYKPKASTDALLQACDTLRHDAGFCLLSNPNFEE